MGERIQNSAETLRRTVLKRTAPMSLFQNEILDRIGTDAQGALENGGESVGQISLRAAGGTSEGLVGAE